MGQVWDPTLTSLVAAVSSSAGDPLASPERREADASAPLSAASTLKNKVHGESPAAKIKPARQLLRTPRTLTPANLGPACT